MCRPMCRERTGCWLRQSDIMAMAIGGLVFAVLSKRRTHMRTQFLEERFSHRSLFSPASKHHFHAVKCANLDGACDDSRQQTLSEEAACCCHPAALANVSD